VIVREQTVQVAVSFQDIDDPQRVVLVSKEDQVVLESYAA
jgi:hypothetical protein